MELLAAHKELIEVLDNDFPQTSNEERLVILGQAIKTLERT